jgi:Tol biopolymer transport system component
MLALTLAVALSGPAVAFHSQSPNVAAITTAGDTDLPRVPSQGRRTLALAQGQEIQRYLPFETPGSQGTQLSTSGAGPAVSYNGRTVAWGANDDPLQLGLPGWQIMLEQDGVLTVAVTDPSGSSANPSLDKRGKTLVFESQGDLTSTGTLGVNRVYVRDKNGLVTLASTGLGTSGNAMVSAQVGLLAFESTSNPVTGADTGVTQIWAGRVGSLPAQRITAGSGASTSPLVSDDGRLVVFQSTADLAVDGADTGISQIFVYDDRTQTFAQLTNEVNGCSRPAVAKVSGDWRITFVCDGQAYYHMLRANQRYHVPTPDGSTQAMVPEMGVHFVTVSTTADLLEGSGTTAGHQVYMLNLWKAPATLVPGSATWFPFQGIPGF